MKEIKGENIIVFRNCTLKKLMQVVNIKKLKKHSKFYEWFSYDYKISEKEKDFFLELIDIHELHLSSYSEQKLSIRFIGAILNQINFHYENVKDWYGSEISCELNGFILKGKPDLIVATGIDEVEEPYFFIQEYKKSINPSGNPEYQLIAGMITAMELNKKNKIYGSFIVGRIWQFVILEKLENGNYEYFVSYTFDSLRFQDLKQIYKNLQGVKFLYCK